jgi:cytochrome b pre-mRNA-processing protein 3
MVFARLFNRSNPQDDIARALYGAMVAKARDPAFYATLAVPDTVNGRFDMLVIHAMLVLRRLRDGGPGTQKTGEALLELLFRDMDQSLREMGVGDMGIGKHIKRMAKAFYGRAAEYEAGLDGASDALNRALKENIYRKAAGADDAVLNGMADYLRRANAHLSTQNAMDIDRGSVDLNVPVQAAP